MEQANLEFHQRVQRGFSELARQNPDRIVRINADRTEDEVTQEIQTILNTRLAAWGYSRSSES